MATWVCKGCGTKTKGAKEAPPSKCPHCGDDEPEGFEKVKKIKSEE